MATLQQIRTRRSTIIAVGILLITLLVQWHRVTPYMNLATINVFCLFIGFLWHRHWRVHVPLMLGGIGSDVVLVGLLQAERHALQTAMTFKLSIWNQLHIGCATVATLLYLPAILFGFRILKQVRHGKAIPAQLRKRHRNIGRTALVFRILAYCFMYSMLFKPPGV